MCTEDNVTENRISIVALIVTFNPDERLLRCVYSLAKSVSHVVIVDNNSTNKIFIEKLRSYSELSYLTILELDINKGIAGGLNYGINFIKNNFSREYVLTLDQDTILIENNLDEVIKEANKTFDKIGIIALGTNKIEKEIDYREIKYVITSGNLIRMEVFYNLKFREEFFMDQVDFDFDYEVIKHGYRIVLANGRLIDHRLGTKRGKLSYEPPIRMYYVIRNSTVLLIERKIPLINYAKQILYWTVPSLLHDGGVEYSRIFITALIDGLSRKLGKKLDVEM